MTSIDWQNDYSAGVEEIDNQNKDLIDMLKSFFDAMEQGQNVQILQILLDDISDLSDEHFFNEEKQMIMHRYPEFDNHKDEHKRLNNVITELKNTLKSQSNHKPILELKEKFINHFIDSDKKLGLYLRTRGIK